MTFPIVLISRLRFSNAHPTHNNLVKSRSFFFLTCRLRGIESRPNERGDKALCNNVLSIWIEKRGVFVIMYSSRVSLRDYSPNWRVAMFFFCEVKKLCKRTLNVREIHYKLISKVVLYIFYLELNLLFVFLPCSINVKLFIYQFLFSKCFRWCIDIVNE